MEQDGFGKGISEVEVSGPRAVASKYPHSIGGIVRSDENLPERAVFSSDMGLAGGLTLFCEQRTRKENRK